MSISASQWTSWMQLMNQIRVHRASRAAAGMFVHDRVVDEMNGQFLRGYRTESQSVVDARHDLSLNDTLFTCLCRIWAVQSPPLDPPKLFDIFPLVTELAAFSCVHSTSTTSVLALPPFPAESEIADLRLRVAHYISEFLVDRRPAQLVQHVQTAVRRVFEAAQIRADTDGEESYASFALQLEDMRVPGALRARYRQLKAPPIQGANEATQRVLETELREAGIARYTTEDAERDRRKKVEADERAERERTRRLIASSSSSSSAAAPADEPWALQDLPRGWVWQTEGKEIVKQLIPLASRVFYALSIETYWLSVGTRIDPLRVLPGQRDAAQRWLSGCCAVDYTSTDFPRLFLGMSLERLLPVGARTQTLRSRSTFADRVPATDLTESELGPDMYGMLRTAIGKRLAYTRVASDPTTPEYDMLLLCMFVYQIKQALKSVDLVRDGLFIPSSQLGFDSFAPRAVVTSEKPIARRPVMLCIQRQWWVHQFADEDENEHEWYGPCTDTCQMILQWMALLHGSARYRHGDLADGTGLRPPSARDDWIHTVFTPPA